jgi:hypothetical protein
MGKNMGGSIVWEGIPQMVYFMKNAGKSNGKNGLMGFFCT